MQKTNCAHCNFKGDHQLVTDKIYCFYWQRLKNTSDSCDKWQPFVEQSRDMRQRLAAEEKRRDEELQKKNKRSLNNNLFNNVLLEKKQKELSPMRGG